MPLFEYKCEDCGCVYEDIVKNEDDSVCIDCGSKNVIRLYSTGNVIYKTGGFYSTDKNK